MQFGKESILEEEKRKEISWKNRKFRKQDISAHLHCSCEHAGDLCKYIHRVFKVKRKEFTRMQHNNNGFGKENVLERELTEADLADIYGGNGKSDYTLPTKQDSSSEENGPSIYDLSSFDDIVNFLGL